MKYIKSFRLFENDSVDTLGNENGMGPVKAPIVSEVPGQVNILPSQQIQTQPPEQPLNEIMSFKEFLNEDAYVTMGNCNGVSAPTESGFKAAPTSAIPGDVAHAEKGGPDTVAHNITSYQQYIPKKKKKYHLKPKTKKFESHTRLGLGVDLKDPSKAYVTRISDWPDYPL